MLEKDKTKVAIDMFIKNSKVSKNNIKLNDIIQILDSGYTLRGWYFDVESLPSSKLQSQIEQLQSRIDFHEDKINQAV
jgi:hypothetical protein